MFKTMDDVEVYDKSDVDDIANAINADVYQNTSDITNLKTSVQSLQTGKADKSELNAKADTTDLTETNTRVSNLENNKATNVALSETNARVSNLESSKASKSEVSSLVQDAVDNIITAKVQGISSDINHIVDNAVDDALEGYDTSAQVTQKINDAVPTVMTTSEAIAIIDNYF